MTEIKKGTTVYDKAGREYEYLAAVEGSHIAHPIVECNEWFEGHKMTSSELGDPVVLDRVFLDPPTEKLADEIKKLNAEITVLAIERNRMKAEFDRENREIRD